MVVKGVPYYYLDNSPTLCYTILEKNKSNPLKRRLFDDFACVVLAIR